MCKKLFLFLARTFPLNKLRIKFLRLAGHKINIDVYLGASIRIISDSSQPELHLIVGKRVSIAPNATFILVSGANKSKLSSIIPWKYGNIELQDDCWIGTGVIIYPNIVVGNSSIVLAGSVVTKDVPPYTIVGGVPAKVIKSIDMQENENTISN